MIEKMSYGEFVHFLKDNGIYHSFKKNYFEQPNFYYDCYGECIKTLNELCEKIGKKQIIADSFQWDKTKEGFKFWNTIHDNFTKYCDGVQNS